MSIVLANGDSAPPRMDNSCDEIDLTGNIEAQLDRQMEQIGNGTRRFFHFILPHHYSNERLAEFEQLLEPYGIVYHGIEKVTWTRRYRYLEEQYFERKELNVAGMVRVNLPVVFELPTERTGTTCKLCAKEPCEVEKYWREMENWFQVATERAILDKPIEPAKIRRLMFRRYKATKTRETNTECRREDIPLCVARQVWDMSGGTNRVTPYGTYRGPYWNDNLNYRDL